MTHNHGSDKVNIPLLSIVSIIAIVLMVYMTASFENKIASASLETQDNEDLAGAAITVADINTQSNAYCKLIVGRTTVYDDTTLAITLGNGESTYYSGYTVAVYDINADGCVVDVNGNQQYLATGQVQRLGSLYVTVKDAAMN